MKSLYIITNIATLKFLQTFLDPDTDLGYHQHIIELVSGLRLASP